SDRPDGLEMRLPLALLALIQLALAERIDDVRLDLEPEAPAQDQRHGSSGFPASALQRRAARSARAGAGAGAGEAAVAVAASASGARMMPGMAGWRRFQEGHQEPVALGAWRVDLANMAQYRAEDPARRRAVRRDAPPTPGPPAPAPAVSAPAAASASASDSGAPAKRPRLLELLSSASDAELLSGDLVQLAPAQRTALAQRFQRLARLCEGCAVVAGPAAAALEAANPGQPTKEPAVRWFRSDASKSCAEGRMSMVKFRLVRLFARIGTLPVLFQVRSADVVNAEAEFNQHKLSVLKEDETEGELLFPPPPYEFSADGESDIDVQMMPLKAMEAIRARCGVTDARPANEWLCAVLKALIEVMFEKHRKDLGDNTLDELEEMCGEGGHFDAQYLPSEVMPMMEMVKEKMERDAAAKAAAAPGEGGPA
ncbi:unnamed protein product, partial [Effrenium voratum]